MIGRKAQYKRTEKVILKDKIGAPLEGITLIEKDLIRVLSNYMKVSDMHISFKRMSDGRYQIKIDGIGEKIKAPYVF